MSTKTNPKLLKNNQAGLVSFFVVMIMMIVLSLIVLAFAKITRREQRQALDRQLNSQAFYAAETGVNDTMNALKDPSNKRLLTGDYSSKCDGADSFIFEAGLSNSLDPEKTFSYSCLLVDPTPEELVFDNIAVGTSQTTLIDPQGGKIKDINVNWVNRNIADAQSKGCPALGAIADYRFGTGPAKDCDRAILKLELVPFNSSTNRDKLITDRAIFFAIPVDADKTSYLPSKDMSQGTGDKQGARIGASCIYNTAYRKDCTASIAVPANFVGYLRMTSYYYDSSVKVSATDDKGNMFGMAGSQVEIDVTGKANDVLKRIKVYRSLIGDGDPTPNFALQSGKTQCKRFSVNGSAVIQDIPSGPGGDLSTICDPTK